MPYDLGNLEAGQPNVVFIIKVYDFRNVGKIARDMS